MFAQVVRAEVLVCCALQSKVPPPLPPNATDDNESSQHRSGCGVIKIDQKNLPPRPTDKDLETGAKIVNGREAQKGEFPWIVALLSSGRQFCGGSLIDNQNVVTAAVCSYMYM